MIPATTNQACAAVLPCNQLRPRYVQYWLRSQYQKMREDSHGGTQPNWNGQMIKDVSITVPSLAEQDAVISEFDTLTMDFQQLSEGQSSVREDLDALLPSIRNQVFDGDAE